MGKNNLNVLRLIAAFLVLFGHAFVFKGLPQPLFISWGELAVAIFFIISGYLITASWDRDPNLMRFFFRRSLRIFPALIICVFLTIFVLGPLVTTIPLREYFSDSGTWAYLKNIFLYMVYPLPGVFKNNHYPDAVNGALWSLPVEFFMYILVAIVGLLKVNRFSYLGIAIAFGIVNFIWMNNADYSLVLYTVPIKYVFIYGLYFWVGSIMYKFNLLHYKYFNLICMLISVAFFIGFHNEFNGQWITNWLLLPLAAIIFGFGYNKILNKVVYTGDYSYGFYIYAFPVQQAISFFYPNMQIYWYITVCTMITLILAVLSWHLIEQTALSFKNISVWVFKRSKLEVAG